MDSILIGVTAVSLALAAGMGAMLMRTLRLERRRSDARVELLEELAARPEGRVAAAPQARPNAQARPSAPTVAPQPARIRPEASVRETASRTRSLDDFELRPAAATAVSSHDIFGEHEAPSAWPRRLAVIGGLAAVLCAVIVGWRTLSPDPATSTPSQAAKQTQAVAPTLELLSLQHTQQEGTLVISGLVQNPRSNAPLTGVQATVVLLAADGATLATSRAPIDFTTLSPGDESSFLIRIPAPGAVARYRVGFRGEDDRVLGHVDRRNNETVARRQMP